LCWHLTVQAPPNSLACVVSRQDVIYVTVSVCSAKRFLCGINEYIYSRGKNMSYPKQATAMFLLVCRVYLMVGSATNPLDQYILPELVYIMHRQHSYFSFQKSNDKLQTDQHTGSGIRVFRNSDTIGNCPGSVPSTVWSAKRQLSNKFLFPHNSAGRMFRQFIYFTITHITSLTSQTCQ
jgi:hypothetical protein